MSLIDLSITDNRLATDASLATAIRISLLTDRRARPDDGVRGGDLRGWWSDQYLRRPLGSRLWTLTGMKIERALALAPEMIIEALQWMLDDGLVSKVEEPLVERIASDAMRITGAVIRVTDGARQGFGPIEAVL